nr:putative membrane protein [Cedratvirus duvanny]
MSSDVLILVFTLVILFISFFSLGVYSLLSRSEYTPACATNECATNIFNGEKRCPPSGGQINLKRGIEVCNPPFSCRGSTPYAVQEDGGTSSSGLCPPGTTCPCSRTPYCPDYVSVFFSVTGASPYENLQGTNAVVYQNTSYRDVAKQTISLAPLSLPDDVSFCSFPPSWRERVYPRECVRGNLFYLTPEISLFDAQRDSLSCLSLPPCDRGVPVFETSTRKRFCL